MPSAAKQSLEADLQYIPAAITNFNSLRRKEPIKKPDLKPEFKPELKPDFKPEVKPNTVTLETIQRDATTLPLNNKLAILQQRRFMLSTYRHVPQPEPPPASPFAVRFTTSEERQSEPSIASPFAGRFLTSNDVNDDLRTQPAIASPFAGRFLTSNDVNDDLRTQPAIGSPFAAMFQLPPEEVDRRTTLSCYPSSSSESSHSNSVDLEPMWTSVLPKRPQVIA
jgi:hypothetical protein